MKLSELNKILPSHEAKMEVLLSELVKNEEISLNEIVIMPIGTFARGYKKDILKCTKRKWNKKELINLEIVREGIYDMLPKALFHEQNQADPFDSIETYIEESHKEKKEEEEAREFFLPIEQEFFLNRLRIESTERQLTSAFENPLQDLVFDNFWENSKLVGKRYKDILHYLLPLSHYIAGNDRQLEECLKTFLSEKVQIFRTNSNSENFEAFYESRLGENLLGVDTILGEEVKSELQTLFVKIGPIAHSTIIDYVAGGEKEMLIRIICETFLPFELDYIVHVEVNPNENEFVLNDDLNSSRLGISTSCLI